MVNCELKFDQKNVGILGHIYVLFIVICNWVLFRSDNIANALQYLKSMFLIGNTIIFDSLALQYLKSHSIYFIFATFISMPIMKKYNFKSKWKIIHQICIILIFILSIASILNSSFNPFIYYNF